MRTPGLVVGPIVVVAALIIAGCSSSSSPPAKASSPKVSSAPPATTAAIGRAYAAVFGTESTLGQSVASLQNGPAFRSVIVAESKKPAAKGSGAKVTAASLRSGNVAKVTFTIYSKGAPALPNASGLAVQQDGKWKVAAKTFCNLLSLEGTAPKACSNPKITELPD
jgi:hypothetical protein